jgi:phthalate 4,5-dioxygenase
MLSAADNELLTRTGSATPMGALFRRFWIPVLLSADLPDPGGPPRAVRVLGEDFVAFRDAAGEVGLIDPRCSHRGASLALASNVPGGLRCAYHGWTFDRRGACVAAATLPRDAKYDAVVPRLGVNAYSVAEAAGIVWAYLGPPLERPPMPMFEMNALPPEHCFVSRARRGCNWAQACEGGLDVARFGVSAAPVEEIPLFSILPHEAGLVVGEARAADGEEMSWRLAQFLLPSHVLAPTTQPGGSYRGQCWVPIDDESCWVFCYFWNPDRPLSHDERKPCETDDAWSVEDSQGAIADREREHLGPTDAGIVRFRRVMLDAARAMTRNLVHVAVRHPEAFHVRAGVALAHRDRSVAEVMRARFGDVYGRVRTEAEAEAEE